MFFSNWSIKMQYFFCMFCEEEVEIKHLLEVGQEVSCPACLQQYEVISTNPFQVQPDNISYDDVLENPEKQARARRMQHRSKLDSDVDEEEKSHHGKLASRSFGKRSQPPKRIRGYVYDRDDD
jgi:DNA-directed RNA polymerase subunit RPC12/RpoP